MVKSIVFLGVARFEAGCIFASGVAHVPETKIDAMTLQKAV